MSMLGQGLPEPAALALGCVPEPLWLPIEVDVVVVVVLGAAKTSPTEDTAARAAIARSE